MSRFKKLSHTVWHCQYHIVWTSKYRLRILEGVVKQEVPNCIHTLSEQKKCEAVELSIQKDHIHLTAMVPPKLSISDYPGIVKGRTAIRPGCIGISFHYGHSQPGATSVQVRGAKDVFLGGEKVCDENGVIGLASLSAGTNPNMVGRLDVNMANTLLVDVLAGIPDFSGTRYSGEDKKTV